MKNVYPIGDPENECERRTIAYLAKHLLPRDDYPIYHNFELPNRSGCPNEFDIAVVAPHAVYAIEVKGYDGLILGNASEWELESGRIDRSPIPLTNKKARILADLLHKETELKLAWVESLVILCRDEACVRLNDPQVNRVVHLKEAVDYIYNPRRLPVSKRSIKHLQKPIHDKLYSRFRPLRRHNEIGDYKILEKISQNDFYTMFLAEHSLIPSPKRFNLKVYSFDIYAEQETRHLQHELVLRDSNALHRLGFHPHIGYAHPPFPWEDDKIVSPLEWIDGYSLRGLLEEGVELSLARKVDIACQICEGLRYCHSKGVIHRDLQPKHIIVPKSGPVKLVNFDCARLKDVETISKSLTKRLDQRYTAPEVWPDPSQVSPASDLYSAGIIIFELLTGKRPYERIKDVVENEGLPLKPTEVDRNLPEEVDAIIADMCAFKPKDRRVDILEIIEDLKIIG